MRAKWSITCKRRVDLPMPGSPPMRMTEPATSPPPRTRSNSEMPQGSRSSASPATSQMGTGATPDREGEGPFPLPRTSSTRLFQAEQSGHLPSHLADWYPQLWQTYNVMVFKRVILRDGFEGLAQCSVLNRFGVSVNGAAGQAVSGSCRRRGPFDRVSGALPRP